MGDRYKGWANWFVRAAFLFILIYKIMDSESTYELQLIDCNCNNCIFMYRDLDKWQKNHDIQKDIKLAEFELEKEKAISEANLIEDEANRNGMLRVANKMKFQFDKSKLMGYGKCSKFGKAVSFIPNICQLETQGYFIHRKQLSLV